MPLSVRRPWVFVLLVLFGFNIFSYAQVTPQPTAAVDAAPLKGPTSAEVMRDRISKAKANIAVRNYPAAIYELETIGSESSEPAVNAVVNGLLMNVYLEQGDYKRAQEFLDKFYTSYKSNNAFSQEYYSAVAGQIVRGTRGKADRYRAFGLMVSDRNLPLEAVNDIEQMRKIVELVITQAKELSADKAKAPTAIALLEEATTSRSLLARDEYDARRWRDAIADSREDMANSRSTIINAIQTTPIKNTPEKKIDETAVAANLPVKTTVEPPMKTSVQKTVESTPDKPIEKTLVFEPVKDATSAELKKPADKAAGEVAPQKPTVPTRDRVITESKPDGDKPTDKAAEKPTEPAATGPLDVGSLIGYATERTQPRYPAAARNMRTEGVVRVEVVVDENGHVEDVQSLSGPTLLQPAASEAIKKWRFRPFLRNGDPVKAIGFVTFNFAL